MKTRLLILVASIALAGCAPHFAVFGAKPVMTGPAPVPSVPASAVPAAKSLALEDAHVESVTLEGLNTITEALGLIRELTKGDQNFVKIDRALTIAGTAAAIVKTEIAAHPSAEVGKTLVAQAKQLDADAAPNGWVLALLYGCAAGCFVVAGVAAFARGWLATVPIIGAYLADNIGAHLCALLPTIGGGLIVIARAYSWACRHPIFVDVLCGLVVVAATILYVNTYHSGLFGRIGAWLKAQLPWVKHTTIALEVHATAIERQAATVVHNELAKLHGAKAEPAKTEG